MDKKPLIGVSICAVVLLVLGSLTNVVGYQPVKSTALSDSPLFRIRTQRTIHQQRNMITSQYLGEGKGFENDTTPPVTTIYFVPPEPNGLNNRYISDIKITLEATDDISGVDFIKYLLDDNDWIIYTNPLIIKSDDYHRITYYAVDKAGNVEQPSEVVRFKLDQTKPVIAMNYTWERIGCKKYVIIITATCTDATSGIVKVEFYLNGVLQETLTGNGPEYVWTFEYTPLPSLSIKGIAYDKAGNFDFTELENPTSYENQQSQSLSRTVVKVENQ
jgi:hypothetical protein